MQAAFGLAALALAVAVGVSWGRRGREEPKGQPAAQPTLPEAHPIWDAWRAAWVGDVDAHLACFTGPARKRLEAELSATGREALAKQLRDGGATALAIELGRPVSRDVGEATFPVTVQHEAGAERFDYRVVLDGPAWRIAEIVSRGPTTAAPPYAERLAPPAEQGDDDE